MADCLDVGLVNSVCEAFDGLDEFDEVAQDGIVGECRIQYCDPHLDRVRARGTWRWGPFSLGRGARVGVGAVGVLSSVCGLGAHWPIERARVGVS